MKIRDISLISIFSVIVFVQEEFLNLLPNFSLTLLLIMIFSRLFGITKSLIMILIYVVLDSFFMNSINIIYTIVMFFGWSFIPVLVNTLFINKNSKLYIVLQSILYSFLYNWMFIIPSVFVYNISIFDYFIADVPFEFLFAISNLVIVFVLYNPLYNFLYKMQRFNR